MTVYFKELGKLGRMGNILFESAAAIALALRTNDSFGFPTWEYQDDFNLPERSKNNVITNTVNYDEPSFHFTPIPRHTKHDLNIHGYFQSELYFIDYEDEIRKLLTPKYKGNHQEYASIHVRRTDYLTHVGCYNILDMNYYEKAMEACPSKKYLIFSDDIEWCKKHFIGNQFDFSEEKHPVKDFSNMISCTNHIIANSSYSWWASWLDSDSETVVAPRRWFGPKLAPTHDEKDLIPSRWLKV